MAQAHRKSADPWTDGFEAYDTNEPETANPYDLETEESDYYDWNDGWHEAAAQAEENDA